MPLGGKVQSREWHLVRRPRGLPLPEDFTLVDVLLPAPSHDEVVVRNSWLSVDPAMRTRMRSDVDGQDSRQTHLRPYSLGESMSGQAIGVVERVGADVATLAPGDTVRHNSGLRDVALLKESDVTKLRLDGTAPEWHLSALGIPGFTAFVALTRFADLQDADQVFVSSAGGAVGHLAGQMARLMGAGAVVGSAGSPEKIAWLKSRASFDEVVNYKRGDLAGQLRAAAPGGIDVYIENVGGEHLEAALDWMNPGGRIVMCGMISGYNDLSPSPGPRNLMHVIRKSLTIRGFVVGHHTDVHSDFLATVRPWLADGKIALRETVFHGLEATVDALRALLSGTSTGKVLVRL
jgi:NADPH-dependent curcumin reductase CurA